MSHRLHSAISWTIVLTLLTFTAGCGDGDDAPASEILVDAGPASDPSDDDDHDDHVPIPDGARGVEIDPALGYALEELGDGLYWVTNGNEQALFATTGTGVIVIDSPPGLADAMDAAMASVTDEPVTHVIYSHYHHDHIGGAGRYAPQATFIAHEESARILAQRADADRPLPTVLVSDSYTLEVGSQTLELAYHGPGHVPGNLFIHVPRQGVLMVVDIVWPGWVPFTGLGLAEDVPGYTASIDAILTYEFDIFVGGHVGRYGTRDDVEATRSYVADLHAGAGAALGAVDFGSIAAEVGWDNVYLLVDRYFDALSDHCAASVTPNWAAVLGGADVWTRDNCFAVVQSLRVD